jgi:hypothetical protein
MADVVQHPRSPKKLSQSGLDEKRAEARSILSTPKVDYNAAMRMVAEMYDRSALPPPSDLKAYLGAQASALADYPAPIAEQCCCPRTGVTRRLRYRPEVKDILDFCDERLEFYRSITTEPSRPAPLPPSPRPSAEDVARVQAIVARLARELGRKNEENLRAQSEETLARYLREANSRGPAASGGDGRPIDEPKLTESGSSGRHVQ